MTRGQAWLHSLLPLAPVPSHPEEMPSGSFQLMLAVWSASSY